MNVVHAAEMPWGESLVAQRAGGDAVAHKRLFEGEEDSPDNYMLVMSKEPKSFYSPRHRHPWDQVRICLEGRIPIAKGLFVEGGEIGYFPESAHYGPQEGGDDRIVVLLQFGGASGQGFIGPGRVNQARRELAEAGRFEDGVYIRDATEGRRNRDAYEAIWLHVRGGELKYAAPAYKTPIVMRPHALPWRATSERGVSIRQIGVFPHRGLVVNGWRLAPESRHEFAAVPVLRLLLITEGTGVIGGEEVRRWSVVRLQPGEGTELVATGALEFLELGVRRVGDLDTDSMQPFDSTQSTC